MIFCIWRLPDSRSLPIEVYPVRVQGQEPAAEIVEALADANQRAKVDVIVLCRGGGSIEDLWAFNEEAVARAIFSSVIPVVAAIGHEVDYTIADFVADYRAPTPTAAAEAVMPARACACGAGRGSAGATGCRHGQGDWPASATG